MIFFFLFLFIPLIEITLFVKVGAEIGIFWTLALCVLTAVIGSSLIRMQGLQTMLTARRRMMKNELPAKEMFDGLALAFAGAMLITPGFFTDTMGFLLLIPAIRERVRQYMLSHFDMQIYGMESGSADPFSAGGASSYGRSKDETVIEGEYERVDDKPEQIDKES